MTGSQGFPLTKPMAVNTGLRNCAACNIYLLTKMTVLLTLFCRNFLNDDGPQTTFDDDDRHSDNYDDIAEGAADFRDGQWTMSFVDQYNYPQFNQFATYNSVEQRQRPSGHYQQIDPSVLETLRQPPTPSVYASLSPNATDASQTLDTTEPGGAGNTQNYEGLDPATLSESSASHHYFALIGTSQNLTVTSHDYLEVILSSEDENDN